MGTEFTTLAGELTHTTAEKIASRFKLAELGEPYLTLTSPMMPTPVGQLRLWQGDVGSPISKMVYIGLTVPMIQLDSHMVFAFTQPDSAVPHFTVDSVFAGDGYAFHVELWSRVDLGVNLPYMKHVMQPLTEAHNQVKTTEGISPAHLEPMQWAIFSPWMMVWRATETAFKTVRPAIDFYQEHWATLAETGLPPEITAELDLASLADRDRRARALAFSPEIDPVWAKVDRLLGPEMSLRLQNLLKEQ